MVNFVLRHSGLERGEGVISKDILPFPLSFCATAAEISLSLEAGRAQLGQAEGAEASLDKYIQEAGLEAWTFLVTWALNFVYSGRHGEHAECPGNLLEFRDGHEAVRAAIISGFFACPPTYISRRRLRSTSRTASCFS